MSSFIDEDGDEIVVLTDAAARRRPTVAYLLAQEEDEEDMNFRHLAARAGEEVDEDDDDVLASTTTEGDSDSDGGSMDRALSVMDMEAEEASQDEEDEYDYEGDVDEIEVQTMVGPRQSDATTVPRHPDATTVPKPPQANATTIPKPAATPSSIRITYRPVAPRVDSDDDEEVAFEALPENAQIVRARAKLLFDFKIPDEDLRAVDFAVEVARCVVPPYAAIDDEHRADLCAAIRKRTEPDAVRALFLVQQAHASSKLVALSVWEKMFFVQAKAMVNFRNRFDTDIRKRVFQILSVRGENWWDKHHARALARI
jgi:hypothetical protein